MKLYYLERSQILPRTPAESFAFFADPHNLQKLTPDFLHFAFPVEPPPALAAGSVLDYGLRLFGVPLRWQSLIEVWQPPRRFVDLQLKGPYAFWRHRHLFEDAGNGQTRMQDRVDFAMPLGVLGRFAYRAVVRRTLERVFDFRAERLKLLL